LFKVSENVVNFIWNALSFRTFYYTSGKMCIL